jgi:hypothetical protein
MVPAASHRIPRAPWYSGSPALCPCLSPTGLSPSMVRLSSTLRLDQNRFLPGPTTPTPPEGGIGLGSFRFARRYSGNRFFFLFLQVLRWFTSLSLLPRPMDSAGDDHGLPWPGSPIRIPPDHRSLAAPRGFSQLAASFFASLRQGIHRIPLVA